MKIVHIITRLVRGGADENTIATCNLQAARGHQVYLMHGRDLHPEIPAGIDDSVTLCAVPDLVREVSPRREFAALSDMTAQLRALAPDVVHTHTSKAGILGRMAARRAGVAVILHGVHILPFLNVGLASKLVYTALERMVAPYTDAYISVSEGMQTANLAAGLGTPDNNFVVASGMDIAGFQAAQPIPERPDGPLLVMVAALEARKRHAEFLPVFADVVKTHPAATLAFLGEGPERPALEAQAASLGITENVSFLGFRTDVARWVAAADICLLSSCREGLPRVVVQYVASGKPVVVAHLPGIEAVVRDGENGFVTDPDDLSQMTAPIRRILDDQDLNTQLCQASRALDVSGWSIEKMEADIETIMTDIWAAKQRA